MTRLVPDDFDVPAGISVGRFVLEPLKPTHVELDYEAVMESAGELRTWSGSPWPEDGFTIAENLADLERHDREHRERVAFTYTVLAPDRDVCLGCVYIKPVRGVRPGPAPPIPGVGDGAAVVGFWVRSSRLHDGLERELLARLRAWMGEEWSFPEAYFVTAAADTRQREVLESEGLIARHRGPAAGRKVEMVLYGEPDA